MVVATETGRSWALMHAIDHGEPPARNKPIPLTYHGVRIGEVRNVRIESKSGEVQRIAVSGVLYLK